VSGWESGGIDSGVKPSSVLVWTFMPSLTAVARMYGLNEEPTCSRLTVAMSYWHCIGWHCFAVIVFPVPLYFHPG
jgi:hypothetical protein